VIALSFELLSARAEVHAAAPTIVFRLHVNELTGVNIHTAILKCQVQIDPRRRRYTPQEAERLSDLFDLPERWNDTMRPLLWTTTPVVLPAFKALAEVEVPVACTYDFDVATAKYFHALGRGEIPLLFQFSGTVFVGAPAGYQVAQVPSDLEAPFRLPIATWREAINQHFPNGAWIRLRRESLDQLDALRRRRGCVNWDELVEALAIEGRSGEPA
jgi:hypothetical protein